MGAVESVKAASDVYAPVSGQVTEVNSALNDEPGLVNSAAESDGWMCKIKMSKPEEVDGLMVRGAQPQPASTQRSPAVPTETRSHRIRRALAQYERSVFFPIPHPGTTVLFPRRTRPPTRPSATSSPRLSTTYVAGGARLWTVRIRSPFLHRMPTSTHRWRHTLTGGGGGGRRMPLARGAAGCAGAVQICPARVLARPLSAPARRGLAGAALEGGWGCMS